MVVVVKPVGIVGRILILVNNGIKASVREAVSSYDAGIPGKVCHASCEGIVIIPVDGVAPCFNIATELKPRVILWRDCHTG